MVTLQPNEDLTPYIGQQLKIEKLGHVYSGVLAGRGAVSAITSANSAPNTLWILVDGTTEYHFAAPGDGWVVRVL